jgi:hypothetical protein
MYSQDLPDWEYIFLDSQGYDRLYGCWFIYLQRSITKSKSLHSYY